MILNKRNILIVCVFVSIVITFGVCFFALANTSTGEASSYGYKIVLDAGHGGKDGGAEGITTGVKESEINLKIVKKLEKYLKSAGFSVVLTRSTDAGLYGVATSNLKKKDMLKRKEIIEKAKPQLVVSVHLNKYSVSSCRGAQVFYKKGDEQGKSLATCVQNSFNNMVENVKTHVAMAGDYYILNCTEYPSIIAECGFLSNPEDERLVMKEEYQDALAYSVFKGIVEYMSVNSFCYFGY